MTDALKIVAKTALIAVITTAIIAVFTQVQFPTLDYSVITSGLKTAYKIFVHWCPVVSTIYPLALTLMGIRLAIYALKFGLIAVKWVMKVNE